LSVNAGARLDRLPISSFHRRILTFISIAIVFHGYDVYVAASVLGATLHSGFSPKTRNSFRSPSWA
jgi:putative MFS transporter